MLRPHPKLGLKFFHWVSKHSGIRLDSLSYSALPKSLAFSNRFQEEEMEAECLQPTHALNKLILSHAQAGLIEWSHYLHIFAKSLGFFLEFLSATSCLILSRMEKW
ncbi:hypothetical protein AMTR_s00024p00216810, partial [Amborella trichopoda]